MSKRLLFVDPVTGLKTFHEYDHLTDETTISYEGENDPVLEVNKRLQNDNDITRQGIKDGFWLYASIPASVQVQWLIDYGIDILNKDHAPRMSKLLNDPEYRYLKTTLKNHQFK